MALRRGTRGAIVAHGAAESRRHPRIYAARSSHVDGRTVSAVAGAGRALAVRPPHERRPNVALLVEACWPTAAAAWMRRLVDDARRSRNVVRVPPRFFLRGGGAAGLPPLRRVSGDVVTAGLISSRFWFGPVPGSP
ncbi:hypothetical protein F511_43608 [Dorcoceras hygrometricum]|uniref:Uncharacterized protein n=1 Tax=Dorcoceras hygrometricum TaxID=472368 RepID=A0A2Z7B3T3_9LAMI|nr:hypothetical protein F511_43608 [Dorcoceras hygrometricum]